MGLAGWRGASEELSGRSGCARRCFREFPVPLGPLRVAPPANAKTNLTEIEEGRVGRPSATGKVVRAQLPRLRLVQPSLSPLTLPPSPLLGSPAFRS